MPYIFIWASLVAQMVKKLPVMQETRVPSLGKDTLKERMTTHSSILALRIPWTEEPVCCARVYVCMLSEKLNEISSVELQMEKREEE